MDRRPMSFALKRLGAGFPNTPAAILTTSRLAVPHLTSDRLAKVIADRGVAGIEVFIDKLYENPALVKTINCSISSFANLPDLPVLMAIESAEKSPTLPLNNGKDFVGVENTSGATKVPLSEYASLIDRLQPDAFVMPHDRMKASLAANQKNLTKAAQRTKSYCQQMEGSVKLDAFYPVVGPSPVISEIPKPTELMAGYMLYGFAEPESVKAVLEHLDPSKPRFIRGPTNPQQAIELSSMGIDLFDTAYVNQISDAQQALMIDLDTASPAFGSSCLLDMASSEYFDDLASLSPECECTTCSAGVTKAYLHHLVACEEMLAKVQLQSHNLHQYLRLLQLIRSL
jgi:hypothetical protein